jgi:hypothetical protein
MSNPLVEPKMSKPTSERSQLAESEESNSRPAVEAERLQRSMLRLLRGSSIDPISYVGLEYCGPEHCGRVGCSEACWFGSLRRQNKEKNGLGRLLREHSGKLYEVLLIRTKWDKRYGDLHEIDIMAGKRLVNRVFDSFSGPGIVAVGTFKVRPSGYNNYGTWRCELHMIVAGTKPSDLETSFQEKPPQIIHDVGVKLVNNVNDAINNVLKCNEPAEPADKHYAGQREEFYAWLTNMKVGSRLIRYGCDEDFKALA